MLLHEYNIWRYGQAHWNIFQFSNCYEKWHTRDTLWRINPACRERTSNRCAGDRKREAFKTFPLNVTGHFHLLASIRTEVLISSVVLSALKTREVTEIVTPSRRGTSTRHVIPRMSLKFDCEMSKDIWLISYNACFLKQHISHWLQNIESFFPSPRLIQPTLYKCVKFFLYQLDCIYVTAHQFL